MESRCALESASKKEGNAFFLSLVGFVAVVVDENGVVKLYPAQKEENKYKRGEKAFRTFSLNIERLREEGINTEVLNKLAEMIATKCRSEGINKAVPALEEQYSGKSR